MIVLTEIQFLGMALAIIGAVFGMIILIISIKRYAPEAFIFMKARKRSIPVAFVHYPDGIVKPYIPRVEIKNPESVAPYYSIGDVGIKFTNPDGTKVERWYGEVPVYHYFKNIPEPVANVQAVAYSQLKDYLKHKDMSIEGIEDVAFYVMSEIEKGKDVGRAIKNAQIEDKETKQRILKFVDWMQRHKEEIEDLKLKSGIYTYQTAMQALDSTIAYTSANVAHAKSVWQAWFQNRLDATRENLIRYGIFLFLAALAAGIVYQFLK